jgi:hypothetical protein
LATRTGSTGAVAPTAFADCSITSELEAFRTRNAELICFAHASSNGAEQPALIVNDLKRDETQFPWNILLLVHVVPCVVPFEERGCMTELSLRRHTGIFGLVATLISLADIPLYFVYTGAPPQRDILTRVLAGSELPQG